MFQFAKDIFLSMDVLFASFRIELVIAASVHARARLLTLARRSLIALLVCPAAPRRRVGTGRLHPRRPFRPAVHSETESGKGR